ncbi:putative leucine-rich repeat receptor-like serine/threonine-protein kinase At2g24130 [Cryptomeria japonica]|uniref:putative leucine-rich repeat receptor-like serine/threonine-protein kinase At2g24130 n=1 Tax=Cryptomeria japonica TaxID=3369 RepID=UPI0027D9F56B|nr:putative leucine-rich repeat receptor-like serine/threonine-protein kinase At2g24130 [Cryptomeria japonica]
MGGKISTRGDVYSYGILLLELLTRRRPTDKMFVEGINLPKWASMHFPNKITEVVDNQLLRNVEELNKVMVLGCLSEFMQIGLICAREDPHQRPTMVETVQRLEKITSVFLGIPRAFHLPIDISPLLEGTSNPRNTNEENFESWSTSTS